MSKGKIFVLASVITGFILITVIFFNNQNPETGFEVTTSSITSNQIISQDPVSCFYNGQLYIGYEVNEDDGTSIFVGKLENNTLLNVETASAHPDDNANPYLISWNGLLYLFWDTPDDISTDGKDRDVAMRAFDGNRWGDVTDISSWDSSEDSGDSQPKAVLFDGEIHVIWENETSVLHRSISSSGKMSTVTVVGEGPGADIETLGGSLYVAWTSKYDSATQDSSVYLRKFTDDVWDDEIVSVNPNIGDLDYFPSLESYDNKLYIAWVTKDKTISSGEGDDDIVVRCYDPDAGVLANPDAWSPITELSDPEEDWDDWPVLHVHSGKLVAVWQTWNHESNDGNDGDDLVMRELEDGTWSEPIKITDTPKQAGDIYERGFSVFSDGEELNILYQRKDGKLSGNDWIICLSTILDVNSR